MTARQIDNIINISIHSLRMEGDHAGKYVALDIVLFQSTPSAWRETTRNCLSHEISGYFNPLPPHGGRQQLDSCYVHK